MIGRSGNIVLYGDGKESILPVFQSGFPNVNISYEPRQVISGDDIEHWMWKKFKWLKKAKAFQSDTAYFEEDVAAQLANYLRYVQPL